MSGPIPFLARPPNPSDLRDAQALAYWMEQQVPCYEDSRPIPWDFAVQIFKNLQSHAVSPELIIDAFNILEERGIKFVNPPPIRLPEVKLPNVGSRQPPQVHAISQKQREQKLKYTAQVLEERYNFAIANGLEMEAQNIFHAALELIVKGAWAYGKAIENRSKLNEKINEIFDRARSLRQDLRRITPAEWESLRRSSRTQTAFRSHSDRISRQLMQQHLQRRRARRRGR